MTCGQISLTMVIQNLWHKIWFHFHFLAGALPYPTQDHASFPTPQPVSKDVKSAPAENSSDEDEISKTTNAQGWSYEKDRIYMMVLSAEEFLGVRKIMVEPPLSSILWSKDTLLTTSNFVVSYCFMLTCHFCLQWSFEKLLEKCIFTFESNTWSTII